MHDCEKCGGSGFYNGPSGEGDEMYCPDFLREKGLTHEAIGHTSRTRKEVSREEGGNSEVYGLPEIMESYFA